MRKNNFLFVLLACLSVIFTPSCSKNTDDPLSLSAEEKQEIMDVALEFYFMGNQFMLEGSAANSGMEPGKAAPVNPGTGGLYSRNLISDVQENLDIMGCVDIIRNQSDEEKWVSLTLDFGADGCEGSDGATRSGKIIVTFNIGADEEIINAELEFANYRVNEYTVNGKYINTITSISPLSQTLTGEYTISKDGGASTTITIDLQNSEQQNTNLHLSGGIEAQTTKGSKTWNWSASYTSPLVYSTNCTYPISGVLSFFHGSDNVGTLNYGSGTCDAKAELTVNAQTRIISLH